MSEKTPHGPYLDKFFPAVYRAQSGVVAHMNKIYPEVDLPESLIELVSVRASQLNGCSACLSIHAPAARRAGVSEGKLDILPSWRESPDYFSEQELAALDLTEELTLLPPGRRHADAALRACKVLAEEQVAALEWAIILINTFNRISIASGHPPMSKI
ncbi:carboxymuconolactone decarboxylase family protein [Corynebacterium breve]|uniref:Carboxymuconolactone decarboxylase family protein n=1 Tax=Corynebacterium breve TaxID=3049799 RepID=A0ABY8VCJ4_9CORY|nr:carboxymuconolactone decarboxylase family protein [Corynebacterium breve]WIM67169.1 carboxymuconolactone decarboxylase family protein [Corynebacterium breve]